MDSNVFRQEFDAQFTTIGRHRAYLSFDRASNVCEVRFVGTEPLVWSLDFNVDPMCMLLMQRVQDDIYVLEEIVIRPDATTEKACRALIERVDPYTKLVHWMHAPLALRIYGDASGHQRRTAGSATDWNQIREFFHMHKGFVEPSFYFASANPLVRDRVNCVNARLRNSDALGYFVSQASPPSRYLQNPERLARGAPSEGPVFRTPPSVRPAPAPHTRPPPSRRPQSRGNACCHGEPTVAAPDRPAHKHSKHDCYRLSWRS
jgi:hypothetical protein